MIKKINISNKFVASKVGLPEESIKLIIILYLLFLVFILIYLGYKIGCENE